MTVSVLILGLGNRKTENKGEVTGSLDGARSTYDRCDKSGMLKRI